MALAVAGCFIDTEPSVVPPFEFHPVGMRQMASKGKAVRMGATGELAAPNEGPRLNAQFSYDFWIDVAEVTQYRFRRVMGRNPVPEGSAHGYGDDHPVVNVTWYDAALYCNALGRQTGLDTVYTYTRVESGPDGTVYGLVGLSAHLDRKGFRLPTESEWEFAARAGGDADFPWGGSADSSQVDQFSWYIGNAQGASHPVAHLKPNAFGLYDMSGNVMEWMGDWKGTYPATEAVDFAGARDPGPEADIPVKGGAFNYGTRELRPANRSATYATIRSSAADYVGFRCVLGVIDHPRYSSPNGDLSATDPVALSAPRAQAWLAGHAAKLVFVNASIDRRHLAYVDFGRLQPKVVEFTDIGDVYHPAISPDGRWVAFCTRPEGTDTGSTLYVRPLSASDIAGPASGSAPITSKNGGADSLGKAESLGPGFIPRWWVDPAGGDTLLIYTTSAVDNLDPRWRNSRTLLRKLRGGKPMGEPIVLPGTGGFHDGRSRNGRYLATGYRTLRIRDLEKSTDRTLFTAPLNGKAAGDTSQVCNVSMAPDTSGRTLFLDFGYEGNSGVTGGPYGIHQVAFLGDAEGRISRWFPAPAKDVSWDDLEWSNHPDYAVAALKDAAGGHHELRLLNLKDSTSTALATGTALAQPCLWVDPAMPIGPAAGLDPDSLGHYNDPATTSTQTSLSDKLNRFWKVHQDLELVALGSSHVEYGIDPHHFTTQRAFNLGFSAGGLTSARTFAVEYAMRHCPKLKTLVVEVHMAMLIIPNADWVWPWPTSQNKGFQYDKSHGFWQGGLPEGFHEAMRQAPNGYIEAVDSLGNHPKESGSWGGKDPQDLSTWGPWTTSDSIYRKNLADLKAFAALVSGRGIQLVLVVFPQSPAFADKPYYQRYGPSQETARAVVADLRGLESLSDHVHFYDAHQFGKHDYPDSAALDIDHMAAPGARKLTDRLDSLIRTFPPGH